MNISVQSRGVFYFYQLTFGDASNADTDKGIVILSGVRNATERNSFLITSKLHDEMMTVKGANLIGDGTLSVSISE